MTDTLHQQIMNLPCKPYDGTDSYTHYCRGHKDARHAAADLLAAAPAGPGAAQAGRCKLMPVEPTPEMVDTATRAAWRFNQTSISHPVMREAIKAMFAAHLNCGACPGDGSVCSTVCRHSQENPPGACPGAATAGPLPGALVIEALRAMDEEARKRGEMYPQTADEQNEDSKAVRNVIKSLEFYTSARQSGADGWPSVTGWPALPLATPSTEGADDRAAYLMANPDELRKFVDAAEKNADDYLALNRAYTELRTEGAAVDELVSVDEVAKLASQMWRGEPVPGRVLRFGAAVLGLVDAATGDQT